MKAPRGQAVEERSVWRSADAGAPSTDPVAIEAPLELRHRGQPLLVVMRTPGNDDELALGIALAEGWIDGPSRWRGARAPRPETLTPSELGNVLELDVEGELDRSRLRSTVSMSSCGLCGAAAIADLAVRSAPVGSAPPVAASVITSVPELLRSVQPAFERTGSVHAAGLFEAGGGLLAVREDVGRHNAVDKVLGWAAIQNRLEAAAVLCVSGRVSFEIVQKAILARVPVIVAVSAPTSLAIDVAEEFRITLCGFTRGGGFNVYAHSTRIQFGC